MTRPGSDENKTGISNLEAAFRLHTDALLRFLSRLVGEGDAPDLLQETFARALQGISGFRGEASLKNWLYRIAGNLAVDHLRKTPLKTSSVPSPYPVDGDEVDQSGAFRDITDERPWNLPSEIAERKEMLACVAQFINELQPAFKTIILLREIDRVPLEDIPGILGISPENVRVRLHRARRALKKALALGCHIYQGRAGNVLCDRT